MKINLKKKVMLALLAGGMLCANSAFAADPLTAWYGKADGNTWGETEFLSTAFPCFGNGTPVTDSCPTGAYLTLDGTETGFASVTLFAAGYGYTAGTGTTVSDNTLIIMGGDFTDKTPVAAFLEGVGGDSAVHNTLIIKEGTFNGAGAVTGGSNTDGVFKGNVLRIEGGTFENGYYVGASAYSQIGGYEAGEGNIANISGGVFTDVAVVGGLSQCDDAIGNEVIISGGEFKCTIDCMIIGGVSSSGDSSINNKVTITGGVFTGVAILGGWSPDGDAIGNELTISGGQFNDGYGLCGGVTSSGTSTGNTLNLKTVIAGTAAEVADFQNMNFTIPAGATSDTVMLKVATPVVLHDATNGDITFNTNLNGLSLTGNDYIVLIQNVNGTDFSETANLKILNVAGKDCLVYSNGTPVVKADFTITTNGATSAVGDKYYNDGSGTTDTINNNNKTYSYAIQGNVNFTTGENTDSYSDNEVIIRRGTYSPAIYGAFSTDSDVTGNKVNIYDGTFGESDMIYGGYSDSGDATSNTVNIISGTFGDYISVYGGDPIGNATGNTVNISGGTFGDGICIYGGDPDIDATDNKVNVSGGTFGDDIYIYGGDAASSAIGNKVNVSGSTFGDCYVFYGGEGFAVLADGNMVEISNGSFGNDGTIYGGYSSDGNANDNKVTITGGTFGEGVQIIGGFSYGASGCYAKDNIVNITGGTFGEGVQIIGGLSTGDSGCYAKDNIVNITGGTFADDFILYGGYCCEGTSYNNTLNLKIKIGGKAEHVALFQTMNFTLPSNTVNGDKMLKTQLLQVTDNDKTATINVYAANGVKLKAGDVITLVDSDETYESYVAGDILGGAATFYYEGEEGEDKNGDTDSYDLVITLLRDFEQKKSAGSEDQQKAPVEGVAAAVQIVNQSADLASGEGMKSLVAETAGGFTNTFGAFTAGSSKYKTGSHVDVDGWGVLVGAGKTKEWKNGTATTYGLFFEYGKGDFDTYNGNVHGDGNSENKGIGIMARHKLTNNTYYEGNIRYGKQETEWGESELGSYDTDSRYYGIMLGVGHIYPVGKNEIDVYGRYTYGHVGACDATVKDSEYHFDSVKSHRVRLGAKYNFVQENSKAKPFIGLAWEHEFKGESKASISGVGEAPAPSMKGNTGILEVGCDWNVSEKWTVGLGANAYMGKRKGWDGMARVFYNF